MAAPLEIVEAVMRYRMRNGFQYPSGFARLVAAGIEPYMTKHQVIDYIESRFKAAETHERRARDEADAWALWYEFA